MLDARFPVEIVGGVPVVAAPEEIDITNADGLRAALLQVAAYGHGSFAVDMTRTRFCDCAGLHTLVAAHKRAQAENRELLLVIPSTVELRIFAITGLDRVIPAFASLDAARHCDPAAATARPDGAPEMGEGSAGPPPAAGSPASSARTTA